MITVHLDHIQPNPWQTRRAPSPDHIRELADDILAHAESSPATHGLLQIPAGRILNKDGSRYPPPRGLAGDITPWLAGQGKHIQLVFGHNRLAAFRLLAETDDAYNLLPVQLVGYTDQEMATTAWSENAVRQNLTPIEEALAIQAMIDAFKWTHDQVAAKLGLHRTTITNKLRLLRLPESAQEAIIERKISERQAVAILPAAELPQITRERIAHEFMAYDVDDLVHRAIDGESSDDLRGRVTRNVALTTVSLEFASFPLDHVFTPDDPVAEAPCALRSQACDDCPLRFKHDGAWRCPDQECLNLKRALWAEHRLALASAATGIPIDDSNDYVAAEYFYGADKAVLVPDIIASGCPNLRLRFQPSDRYRTENSGYYLDDFQDVRVICVHGNGDHDGEAGHCQCLAAATPTDKEEQRRSALQAEIQRQNEKRRTEIIQDTATVIALALDEGHLPTWRELVRYNVWGTHDKDTADWNLDTIHGIFANDLVHGRCGWNINTPDRAQEVLTNFLTELGLELPWPDPAADPVAVPAG